MIAIILLYICFGMLTTVTCAFIREVAADPLAPRVLALIFLLWPVVLCALFAQALEASK